MTRKEKFINTTSLAELMEMAIEDMEALMSDKRYRFHAGQWHGIYSYSGKCTICTAGAVMANTLGANIEIGMAPGCYKAETRNKLRAIDKCRKGDILSAHRLLGNYRPVDYIKPRHYDFNDRGSAKKFIKFWRDKGLPILKGIEIKT